MEQESHVMKATELRLGLPGSDEPVKKSSNKRASSEIDNKGEKGDHQESSVHPTKWVINLFYANNQGQEWLIITHG